MSLQLEFVGRACFRIWEGGRPEPEEQAMPPYRSFILMAATILLLGLLSNCGGGAPETEDEQAALRDLEKIQWGEIGGMPVYLYTLSSGGLVAKVTNYGTNLTELHVPDHNGQTADVVLGLDTLDEYVTHRPFLGCILGRVANRVAKGSFSLDGKDHTLTTNWGSHHLHGGHEGLNRKVWTVTHQEQTDDHASLTMMYTSPDGEEGYPGNLEVSVTYRLSNRQLRLEMLARTDAPTIVNLSNHTYWNLAGHGSGDILGHQLRVDADHYTPGDADGVPTGEIRAVAGTPFDFTQPKPIGKEVERIPQRNAEDPGGYDVNFVLNGEPGETRLIARVVEPLSGRVLEVSSTQPGVQLYTGNHLNGSLQGKDSMPYEKHAGFCLESQHYPDSINKEGRPGWPSVILRPGESYRHVVAFKFSAVAPESP